MKAILVVDIDDSLIEGEERFAIDGYLMQESDCVGCYETVGRISNVVLKPMPNKKPVSYHDDLFGEIEKNFNNIGWNACLDEIMGEDE